MPHPSEIIKNVKDSAANSINTILFIVALLILAFFLPSLVETNDAGFTKILQVPVSGTMKAFTEPGMFMQWFGQVNTYKVADILYFSKHDSEGRQQDDSIEVRFNDGAVAKVTGNVRVELPVDPDKLIEIHKKFRSYDSLIKDTVRQVVSEATILTAALMTAEESYTTKRAEFSQMAYDQLLNGIYLTEADTLDIKDVKTGEVVKKSVVRIQKDAKGMPLRKEQVLSHYGVKISQFVVKEIDYEKTVADQINSKQQALMQVVSAKASAERAVQDRLTAEEVGKKNVAVAKYEQEVEKAKAITAAEKELEVAKLNKTAAEQFKQMMILKGEGEGEYRRKLMAADGALDKKLSAYIETQKAWADALARSAHPLVPSVMLGGALGAGGGNAALTMMEILAVKAAKELSVDLHSKGGNP